MCEIIRDSVNGIKKYCRIPVRCRRTPILAEEFFRMLEHQLINNLSDGDMAQEAFALCEEQEYEQAGKIFTYLDFMKMIEVEPYHPQRKEEVGVWNK